MKGPRLVQEAGYASVLTREEAPGAIPNGSTIAKTTYDPGDAHQVGALGTVLGSIGPLTREMFRGVAFPPGLEPVDGEYCYCVAWEEAPQVPVFVRGSRIEAHDG